MNNPELTIQNYAIDDGTICLLHIVRRDAISGEIIKDEVIDCIQLIYSRKNIQYMHPKITRENALHLRAFSEYKRSFSNLIRVLKFGIGSPQIASKARQPIRIHCTIAKSIPKTLQ
jgi:hypothetical protein